jgi:two-component system response regulator PilR (NtrC family)
MTTDPGTPATIHTHTPMATRTADDSISILVVDDERSMRDFLKILLQKEGYAVVTADNGEHALDCLKDQEFNLVITDIRMPGMGGLELLETVKDSNPELPVIMITAFASPDDAVLAM